MKSDPKVSVIIPCYNRKSFLECAIESVLSQTYSDYEIIIVDDGSTDGTKEFVAEKYSDDRLKYFYKENGGLPSKARNFGMEHARGQYLAFLDSDDHWYPHKLETQVKVLDNNPHCALTSSTAMTNLEGTKEILSSYFFKKNGKVFWWLIVRNFIITSSVMVRRSVIDDVGVFKDTSDFKIAEDLDLWLRITRKNNIRFIKEPLLYYQMHEGSISSSVLNNLEYVDRVVRSNLVETKIPKILKQKIYGIINLKKFLVLRKKDRVQAKRALKELVLVDPLSISGRLLLFFLK